MATIYTHPRSTISSTAQIISYLCNVVFSCWARSPLRVYLVYSLSDLCNLVFQLRLSSSAHCSVCISISFCGRFLDRWQCSFNSLAVMASDDGILSQVVVDKMSLEVCRTCFDAAANSTDSGVSAFTINICAMSVDWHRSPPVTVWQFYKVCVVNRHFK